MIEDLRRMNTPVPRQLIEKLTTEGDIDGPRDL